jgi:hypothetical protein
MESLESRVWDFLLLLTQAPIPRAPPPRRRAQEFADLLRAGCDLRADSCARHLFFLSFFFQRCFLVRLSFSWEDWGPPNSRICQ